MPYIGQQTVQVASVNAATPADVNRALTALANSINTLLGALQSGRLTLGGAKFDSQRSGVPSTGPGPLDPNVLAVTAGGVTTWYGWNGSSWVAFGGSGGLPAVSTMTSATPAGTTSATAVMMGLAAALTPGASSQVLALAMGQMQNSTLNDGVTVALYYGTGTAPSNGAAVTGTLVGIAQSFTEAVTGLSSGFTVGGTITGLTPTTAYWFDLAVLAVTGGTASVTGVTLMAQEV